MTEEQINAVSVYDAIKDAISICSPSHVDLFAALTRHLYEFVQDGHLESASVKVREPTETFVRKMDALARQPRIHIR